MYRAIRANDDEELTQEEMLQYPLAREIDRCCRKYGYAVYDCSTWRNGRLYLSLVIINKDTYRPEIFYNGNSRHGDIGFKIQTGSFGALVPEEFEKFIQCYDDALNLVKKLDVIIERIGIVPGETVALYQD